MSVVTDAVTWVTQGDNFKSIVAPFISPILVMIGWRVISRDNDRRETRKETRAVINDFVKKVDDLQKDATNYFCFVDKAVADAQEVQVKRSLERLELVLSYLHRIDERFDAEAEHTALSNLITGHPNFESSSKMSLPVKDPVHLQLALCCSNLIKRIEFQFIDAQIKKKGWLSRCWQE